MQIVEPIFQENAFLNARLSIWIKKLGPILQRLTHVTLQKIFSTPNNELVLHVYKPGDDRSYVVFNISHQKAGAYLLNTRPSAEKQPNSLVQVMRKYFIGKRVQSVYLSAVPTALVIEFEDATTDGRDAPPNALILDLDHKPARVAAVRKYKSVPERYIEIKPFFENNHDFFKS